VEADSPSQAQLLEPIEKQGRPMKVRAAKNLWNVMSQPLQSSSREPLFAYNKLRHEDTLHQQSSSDIVAKECTIIDLRANDLEATALEREH
jgi:hypothetical protein